MKNLLSILFVTLIPFTARSQQPSNWKNYTDMQQIHSAASVPGGIWAATSGGGFFYNSADSTFKTYHKTEGLTGISLTSVTVDGQGKIWFGSSEGAIDVYNPADNSITPILDIFNSDKSSKSIRELRASGDTILVSTDFGVSLIDSKNLVFGDTYFKFGGFSSNIPVNSSLKAGLIYTCTASGVAIQKKGAINLSAPESWNVYTTADGLPSNNVNKLISFGGSVIAATDKGLAQFDGTKWSSFLSSMNGKNIGDVTGAGDTLFVLAGNTITVFVNGTQTSTTLNFTPNNLVYSQSLGLLAGSDKGILVVRNYPSGNFLVPNGPEANQFPYMSVSGSGVLWSASGKDVTGKGFYKFDGSEWTNYNKSNTSEMPNNYYYTVFAGQDNTTYLGNWGSGFLRMKGNNFQNFNSTNTGMSGIQINPKFLVITGFGFDSKNNLWVLNYGAADRKTLSMFTPDSVWYHFGIPAAANLYLEQNFGLVIDQYDTKWFYSLDPSRTGLYYFNENKTYDNPNDDASGYITTASGLNSNSISCVAADLRGDIWVGTNLGVNVITNTETLLTSDPQVRITSVFSLRQQTINCMAVDPLNQKWVGTNQGLLLVNSDGTSLLAAYNTKNSPLLSDQIRSIAIDKNDGIVYVGTDAGLTSFKTSAINPVDSFSDLFMYPSPFVLKSGDNKMTIDGLIKNTDIKILSITGKLIAKFSSPGGRVAYWDGRDSEGNLVSSGVYIVVAYDKDGNNVASGKIAVLNK